ncbi:hypothetical protein HMPREF9597_02343 [Cutibacterium acnes HL005PA4]|nr:hypothetical protein PAZ_c19810 [Cutibacterium acnes 266]EFD03427.1 hypothetical protein HMPREF1034_1479 [Cutibacterium acnes SK187]EFD07330.1 hypothetical protein HMPREF9207_1422 [Cutibacterium acnes J165]EFS43635.1 hypothetical protein HMPREF9576_01158 [Cutibacterium acnes HL110PA2]EFS46341.1 hypothetical protein HMPREF9580_01012 [Cutibacterium acnes HL087PA2]EFS49857.1 hypothetical protein HMPREF9587_02577 [Cutibacterium acnes HL025PA1]EFS54603.1 hypothetical protein HMPREF9589_00298 [C
MADDRTDDARLDASEPATNATIEPLLIELRSRLRAATRM